MTVLVGLKIRWHKVEDTGMAELSFGFCRSLGLRNVTPHTAGKGFQLYLWILKRLEQREKKSIYTNIRGCICAYAYSTVLLFLVS